MQANGVIRHENQVIGAQECLINPVWRRLRQQKKTDFQKSCKKNVQEAQLVLVERLASPYRQSIASALRLAVRTSPFHGENRGSIPLGRASDFNGLATLNPENQRLYGKYTEKCFRTDVRILT